MDPISQMMMAGAAGAVGVSVEYVAETSFTKTTADTGTDTVTLSGLQANDVVFLFYVGKDKTASTFVTNTADMSGWTAVLDDNNLQYANEEAPDSYGTPSRGVWYKVSTGSSVSIDLDDVPSNDKNHYSVQLVAFRGLETTGPASPSRLIYQSSAGTSISVPARNGPAFATINVVGHWVGDGSTQTWTQTEATSYTDLGAIGMGTGAEYSSMMVSYLEVSESADLGARAFTNSPSASSQVAFEFFLIAKGEDDSAPVITGSTSVVVTSPATSVTTYSADQSVTWSLSGTDASLFSISSGGALTFSSPSVDGIYQLTITATDPDNFTDDIDVTVTSTTTGTSGGGISLRSSTTAATHRSLSTTVSLTGLSAGDVVYLHLGSDAGSANAADTQASLASNGWTLDTDSGYTSSSPQLHVYWKVTSGGTESLTFSGSGSDATRFAVVMSAWIGVDNTTPTSGFSSAVNASSNSVTVPSWLVPGPGVILYVGGLDDDGSGVSSGPSGYTEVGVGNVPSNLGNGGATIGVYYRNTSGNETTSAETLTFASSDGVGAFAYQLRAD